MITATRIIEIDVGHRVVGHEGKCRTPHGHRMKFEITAEAIGLDAIGRVIDFSALKSTLGKWIDDNWDHTFIVWDQDVELLTALESVSKAKPIFVSKWNPTSENIADFLLNEIAPQLFKDTGITITKIKAWETINCFSEATL
jgi:6-pyruvoyltetrahydropterin/6-carboxytetrahydropterin synthase